jgi:Family of unknown function (DUF6282)
MRIEHAIDLHCHFGPDTVGGNLTGQPMLGVSALQAAREAAAAGHAALVLKSHSFASPALAATMTEAVPGLHVFGGICTDFPSGGLNVAAVESALVLGARIVWLPTLHSYQDVSRHNPTGVEGPGLRVIDETGGVVPEVQEIFAMIRQKGAILATGHVTAEEHYAVVREFAGSGKILVTHAGEELAGPRLTASQCAELAELGATIELTALTCQTVMGTKGKSPTEMAAMIASIGTRHCTLSTDYGWSTTVPRPAAGLHDFLESLWVQGISEEELTTMVSRNPADLLGLDI